MGEVLIPLNTFDLPAFIGSEVSFLKNQGAGNPTPLSAIPVVQGNGSTPDLYEHSADRTLHDELVKDGKELYFPFSNSNMGEPVLCADGKKYDLAEPGSAEAKIGAKFALGADETAGLVVKVSSNQVSLTPAVQFLGNEITPPSVQTINNAGELELGMKNFVEGFKLQ